MTSRSFTLLLAAAGVGVLVLGTGLVLSDEAGPALDQPGIFDQTDVARSDDTPPVQEGVQPQGRGPVHEAFAEPALNTPTSPPVVTKQPPEPVEEMPPATKPDGDVRWISGYWAWDEDRTDFLWVSGIWRATPPGRQWVPGHWLQVSGGWQWSPGFWAAGDQEDVHLLPAPPEPVPEAIPPAPDSTSFYVPGCRIWHESRWVWRPGCWVAYRPGWVWVPAHYVWTPCCCIFVEGYWDYTIQERGLLFAPVCIERRCLLTPGWCYRPCYVVHDQCLLGALFIRRDCGCYCFGDYYDVCYERRGFVAWFDFRIGGGCCCDPLFCYYRHHYHTCPTWERDLRALHVARREGTLARPPLTLVQQQTIVQNIRTQNVNVNNFQHTVMLAPVTRLNPKVVRTTTLDQARIVEHHKAAEQLHAVSVQRSQAEGRLLAQGFTPARKEATPQALSLSLPKQATPQTLHAVRTPPPPPVIEHKATITPVLKPVIPDAKVLHPPAPIPIDVKPVHPEMHYTPPVHLTPVKPAVVVPPNADAKAKHASSDHKK
jgi:WXXGXW repeat (2 copies)